jgi:hypothetical protein
MYLSRHIQSQYSTSFAKHVQFTQHMFTRRKNTVFVNAELSTAKRAAVVSRYAENEVVRTTARQPALTQRSWNQVMQSRWHHRSLCAAISGFLVHLVIPYKNVHYCVTNVYLTRP